jgi:predicted protein tyrosine phosphatase
MEMSQRRHLSVHFGEVLKKKRVVCLNIPNNYDYVQDEPVTVLRAKVLPLLRGARD